MSKIISNEEIDRIEGKFPFESLATQEVLDELLQAQRDSSDREWIEDIENLLFKDEFYGHPAQKFLLSGEWQTLKKHGEQKIRILPLSDEDSPDISDGQRHFGF